ncbi:SigE family RNA polymerase sigma factor [Yinghuangia seranimata]|uniref:SigE family RNA polymerase sigma factor n=1 Tax=Yinghuangia seranimata TaxID=408067 RepID=UPI00248C03C0|nr:SigE family RNA polymerase sigma factor [Yinghuangia seranimata]MDI2130806.1 SigE family RNA polymerase sigma factor [Yinghuangia seranimata]
MAIRSTDDTDYLEFAAARSAPMLRVACLLTGDWHTAEDLVQETLGKVYVSWRRVRAADSPAAYAERILFRVFLSQRRKRSAGETPTGTLPEQVYEADDPALRLTLLDGLARLSQRDRAVLVLRYWEDRSVSEAAQALGLTESAVRIQSLRALRRLRAQLGDQLPELAQR